MLPKIIVAKNAEREAVERLIGFDHGQIMAFEGDKAKVNEVRAWVSFGVGAMSGSAKICMVIWDADKMSPECQAVLLKPLEETKDETKIFLIAESENRLLPTVVSRCLVVRAEEQEMDDKKKYWEKVRECLRDGPAKCLSWADTLEKEEMPLVLRGVIEKLKTGLASGVSKNRLAVLGLAIEYLAILEQTNTNGKLAMGDFLLSSWKLIRS